MRTDAFVLVALVLVAMACGDDASVKFTPRPECTDSVSCVCRTGPPGHQYCVDGKLGPCECPCSKPPPPPPAADAGNSCFEPCGGDPRGDWTFASTCVPQDLTPTCSNAVVDVTVIQADFMFQLLTGGAARGKITTSLSLKLDYPASCPIGCPPFASDDCSRDVCGDCKCSTGGGDLLTFSASSLASTWSTIGADLELHDPEGGHAVFQYCVSGNTLKLNKGTSVTYVLARAACGGTAVACRDRDAATCTQGSGCSLAHCAGSCSDFMTSAECTALTGSCIWQGSCVNIGGGLMCSSSSDAAGCQTRAGCHWQMDGCDGQAASCSGIAVSNCSAQPGCSWVPL
jgi:hypothetical protein